MKKLHIQDVREIVEAWDKATPLKALCGYTRITTEDEYESIRETAPTCRTCDRVLRKLLAEGKAFKYPDAVPADEIRKRASAQQWYYTATFTAVWTGFPLAA